MSHEYDDYSDENIDNQYDDEMQDQDEMLDDEEMLDEEQGDDSILAALAGSMPWVISILVHIGLFLALLFIVLFEGTDPTAGEEVQDSKAISIVKHNKPVGGKHSKNPTPSKSQSTTPATSPTPSPVDAPSTSESNTSVNMAGQLGGGGQKGGGRKGIANGAGKPGGGDGNFMGAPAVAQNVIFLMDISGSMQANLPSVKKELRKSLRQIKSPQTFHIVFFSEGKPLVLKNWTKLKTATRKNKRSALKFIKTIDAAGSTDAVKSIEKAFKIYNDSKRFLKKGTVMFLLTDGAFDDSEKVIKMVENMAAKNKDVAICTFLYCDSEEDEPEAVEILKKIAEITGGQYRYVEPE